MTLWDTNSGQMISELPASLHGCEPHSFSPDWQTLGLVCPNGVTLFDMASRTVIHVLEAYSSDPYSLAFSPDGSLLAASLPAYNCDDSARLWHTGYGQQLAWFPGATSNCIYDVVFSADGSLLGTSFDEGLLQWWSTRDGSPDAVLGPGLDTFDHAAISPDGAILAAVSDNDGPVSVQLWDVDGGRKVYDLTLPATTEGIEDVAFSPDGSSLAVAGYDAVYLVNPLRGTIEHTLDLYYPDEGFISSQAFSADGTILAYLMTYRGSRTDTIVLWNVSFGVEMGQVETDCGSNLAYSGANAVAISPVSDLLAVGCGDGSIELWDLGTGVQQSTLSDHRGKVFALAFNRDGTLLASGSDAGEIILWGIP